MDVDAVLLARIQFALHDQLSHHLPELHDRARGLHRDAARALAR